MAGAYLRGADLEGGDQAASFHFKIKFILA